MRTPTTYEELVEDLDDFNFDRFAFDVETWNPETKELTPHWYELEVFMLSLYDGENSIVIPNYEFEDNVLQYVAQYVDNDATLIAHNIKFDLKAMHKHGVEFTEQKLFDTQIAWHLLEERDKRPGLKKLAKKFLNADTTEIDDAYTPGRITKEFYEYAANDTIWAYELAEKFWPQLVEEDLDTLFKQVEMPFQHAIVEMELNGIKFNEERCHNYFHELEKENMKLREEMLELLGYETDTQTQLTDDGMQIDIRAKHPPMWAKSGINFKSSHHKRKILYDIFGLDVVSETDGGKPATDSDTLKQLEGQAEREKHRKMLIKMQEYSKGQKLMNSFVDQLPDHVDPDGRIRPDFRDWSTVTGRLSCKSPNMQQMPRDSWRGVEVRDLFEASEGKKLIAVDYSGQENRVATQVTEDDTLKEYIQEGRDLHLVNADTVFDLGLEKEQFIKGTEAHAKAKKKYKQKRQAAKVFSYGILYGGTEYTLQQAFNCTEKEAEKYLEDYYNTFPGMKQKREEVRETLDKQGFVRSMYGRKRRFDEKEGKYGSYYSERDFRQAFNHLIQSPGADMMRVALVKTLAYKKKYPERGVNILLTVHDEAVVECNEDCAEQVAEDIEKLFSSVVGNDFIVDMPADSDIGDTYGEAK